MRSFFWSQLAGPPVSLNSARLPRSRKQSCFYIRLARIFSRGRFGPGKSTTNWSDNPLGRWTFKNIPSSRLGMTTALLRPNLSNISGRSMRNEHPIWSSPWVGPRLASSSSTGADLYPATPMLLAAVEARRVEPSMLSEQDAVVGARYDQVAAIENILRLLPETKTIAMVIGNSPNERFWSAESPTDTGSVASEQG